MRNRSLRLRAARVIARRNLLETALGPGPYVVAALALLLAHLLVGEYAGGVEPGGFNPDATALYRLLYGVISSAFGPAFFDALFAEGPFVFAYAASFLLAAVCLAAGSVTRLAMERRAGATELVCYGPADGTSCLLGALARDVALSLAVSLLLLAFLAVLALRYNLAMGPRLLAAAVSLPFLSFAVSASGLLCASATARAGSAAALFSGLLLVSAGLPAARYAGLTGYARDLASALSAVLQWASPFYWWDLALRAARLGGSWLLAPCLLPLAALGGLYLGAAHLLARSAGSRP